MNILILINGAVYHRPFFARVGDALVHDGHDVRFALDSHWTDFTSPSTALPPDRTSYFSDFFEANYARCPLAPEFTKLNLWTAMFPDLDRAEYSTTLLRRRPGYYERLLENLVAYFADLCDRYRIDAMVYETVSNAFSYIASLVAHQRGIRYVGFGSSRLPGHVDVTDQAYFRHARTERLYKDIVAGAARVPRDIRERAAEYVANLDTKRADYVVSNAFMTWNPLRRYARTDAIRAVFEAYRFYFSSPRKHEYAFQLPNPLVVYPEQLARETARWAKAVLLKTVYVEQPDLERPYFIYPLQYHPEASCAVDGAYFNDDLVNIINTSINLPPNHLLYVRDHPHAFAQAPLSLYRRINRLPNVRFVDWTFDSRSLIRSARAVVTSTSSFGFESILLGKPVYVLGHPFYDFHPLVRRIRSWDEAFSQFSEYGEIQAKPPEIQALAEAYFLSSRKGSYDLKAKIGDPEAVACIVKLIVEEASSEPATPQVSQSAQV
jgi:capsule polysaccharide modification protein KpsS